jgi:hypothetical protein
MQCKVQNVVAGTMAGFNYKKEIFSNLLPTMSVKYSKE